MFKGVSVVVKKELKRVFTDRRLVFTTIILPPLMLMIIYWVMGVGIGSLNTDIEEHQSVVYIMNSPEEFSSILGNSKMDIYTVNKGDDLQPIKEDIKEGKIDVLIEFDPNFNDKIQEYRNTDIKPYVNTYYNSAEDYSSAAYYQVTNLLGSYEEVLLGQRLGDITYANIFDIDPNNSEQDIVDDKKADGKMISMMVPMLLTVFLFAGSMGIGSDSIAGEKERGTMATLLLTPVKREVIALGKLISLAIVSFASAVSSFIGIIVALPMLFKSTGEMSFQVGDLIHYSGFDYLLILLVLLALEGVFVGLISTASVISKSVKEASTYMMPIYLVVMIAAFSNMFSVGTSTLPEYAIPIYGSVLVLKDIFAYNINITGLVINVVVSIGVTGLFVYVVKKLFDSEKVMFSA